MKNMKLGVRLALTFGIVLVLLLILCLVASRQMSLMNERTLAIAGDKVVKQLLVGRLKQGTYKVAVLLYRSLDEQTAAGKAAVLKEITEQSTANTAAYKRLDGMSDSDEGRALYRKVLDVRTAYSDALKPVYAQLAANDGAGAPR